MVMTEGGGSGSCFSESSDGGRSPPGAVVSSSMGLSTKGDCGSWSFGTSSSKSSSELRLESSLSSSAGGERTDGDMLFPIPMILSTLPRRFELGEESLAEDSSLDGCVSLPGGVVIRVGVSLSTPTYV